MEFLRTIRKSIYDRDFYATAITAPLKGALKQYSLLIACMAVLVSIPIYISLGAWALQTGAIENIRERALALYPDALILTLQNGELTSNVEEPYAIPMPEEFGAAKETENLIVINTKESVSADDFNKYHTNAILGKNSIWIRDPQKDKIEIQQFSRLSKETLIINKQKVTAWTEVALRVGKVIMTALLLCLPFLLFAILWCAYLVYLLFGAVIIWIVAKLRKVSLTYAQAYKLGLSLITLPIIYGICLVGPLAIFRFPYDFTILLMIMAFINIVPTTPQAEEPVKNTLETPEDSNPDK